MLEDITGRDGEQAVSPVIGVILMVGVVVILAAAIGAFALSFADGGGSSAPQVSLETDYNDGDSVSAGDSIEVGVTGPDYTVELVWQGDDGGESNIIRTLEGPES